MKNLYCVIYTRDSEDNLYHYVRKFSKSDNLLIANNDKKIFAMNFHSTKKEAYETAEKLNACAEGQGRLQERKEAGK